MIALVGDAELDEGNVFEALLESWKHDARDLWWVVDYNRQSLDSVVSDRLFGRIDELFRSVGWRVVTLKYGRLLESAFAEPGGAGAETRGSTPAPTRSTRRSPSRAAPGGASAWRATLPATRRPRRCSRGATTRRSTR